MKILYSTKAKTTGGREGKVETDDGNLKLTLSTPKQLGGAGIIGTTNPEQLFAAGYSACFESAIRHIARTKKIAITELAVAAEIGLVPVETGFALIASLEVFNHGIEENIFSNLVSIAHTVCPYSNALKNNVDVKIKITNVI